MVAVAQPSSQASSAATATGSVARGAWPATPDDELGRFLSERRLIGSLDRLSQTGADWRERADELVAHAVGFLGVPYQRGGDSWDTGFDCSGFVRAIFEQSAGLLLPRRAADQAAATHTIDRNELQPGDLVFYNTMRSAFSHVGIYIGQGRFIHSPKPGAEVRIEDMSDRYWVRRFNGARRVAADPAKSR
ncbi:MAG: peptidoglycan endopeptidase [Betaproteobacteria bacterium]|nr:peptidoglycan endopeptidase [Betaproteobacteria bacterium]NBS46297.1 peptidoglycan endopeptidase [Betaproteobacteria bacterium]